MNNIPLCKCSFCPYSIVQLGKLSCRYGECVLDEDDIKIMINRLKELYK